MFQKWQHTQELKMTKQEVQDERRSMDGDPQIKGRRLRMMRQIAMQQVNKAVPNANVVVTNPTHFSVALQYDQGSMAAPRVVAKGVDHMALRIRQVAMIHKVPIVERPPLARALYAEVEINEELYQAGAEVLAYVYRLEKEAA
jgi:flagellar biosynthetic protein FlhB